MAIPKLVETLGGLDAGNTNYATAFMDAVLAAGVEHRMTDIHLQPVQGGLSLAFRVDGVLQLAGTFDRGQATDVVSRLKVMAGLLTYRNDVPQEGRISNVFRGIEMRVSTFPTLFGERAVVRLFAAVGDLMFPQQLGFSDDILRRLRQLTAETSGALLITGPAGSGKTTTAYALVRDLVEQTQGGRSIVSLEDPIEVVVPGMAQSQVNRTVGFDLVSGLKSLLRQDPEVLLIGEMRDRETAEIAVQASLTGQLVITTFHAGSSVEAISRLLDMGIEPYLVRSGVLGILSQRLLRRLCAACSQECREPSELLGLPIETARIPAGCANCGGSGYSGRILIAELLTFESEELGMAILHRSESSRLARIAIEHGMASLWRQSLQMVELGQTSPREVRRVLGFRNG
jgi:type II secretory ATPase GspE/PulE/Tfp pilus assembly ATPase PilB-like protein